jgi:predicted nucleic acid-binding protein
MTLYLDTSDLVKLYVDEPDAGRVRALVLSADVVVTSALAYPETRATFARRRRERLTTPKEDRACCGQFDEDWRRIVAIVLTDDVARAAGRLAARHSLRGADAVHLASFEYLLGRCDDADVRFSAADDRLVRAARMVG